MALSERLQLIIDADGKGAISGLNKVGAAADRNLGKTDDRLARVGGALTSFGAATVAAAAVAGAGLYNVAQSASAYGEQVNAAGVIFGDSAELVEEFGESASKSAGLSKTAATEAANNFGKMGKAAGLTGDDLAGFSISLVQLAGDLASFNDVEPAQVIQDLGSALQGQSEPMRKYGVFLDDNALKQEALSQKIYDGNGPLDAQQKILAANALIFEQTSDAQGDFERTSGSLANQQRILAAEFENAKVALGQGLLPFANAAVGTVNDLTGAFNGLDDSQKEALGKFAGWAVVGAGVVGSLSLIAGQAITLKDRFTQVVDVGGQAQRQLNNLGRVAIGAAAIGGIAALGTALYELTNIGRDATEQIDRLKNRLNEGNEAQAFDALIERTRELDGGFEDFLETVGDLGRNIRNVDIGGTTVDMYDLRTALEELGAEAPEAAIGMIDYARELGITGGNADELNVELDALRSRFTEASTAAENGAGGQIDYAEAMSEVTGNTNEATSALQEYSDTLRAQLDPQFAAVDAMKGLQEAQVEVVEATAKVNELQAAGQTGTAEYAEAVAKLEEAQFGAVEAAYDQEQALLDLAISLDESGDSTDDVVASLRKYGQQAGLTVDETNAIIGRFLVATGAANEFGDTDPTTTVGADTDPFWTKFSPAVFGAAAFNERTDTSTLAANSTPFWNAADAINRYIPPTKTWTVNALLTRSANVWLRGAASGEHSGGLVSPSQGYIVGEQGPEYFQPATAGTIIPNHDLGNHFGGGGGMGGSVYNINVVAGMSNPAETGRAVVDALRAYERVNGQGWRN